MADSDDKDQDVFATPSEPAKDATTAPAAGGDSGWDDDVWGDEASPPDKKTVMMVQIGLVVLIVLIVGAVVLVKKGDKNDEDAKSSDGTSQTTGDNGSGDSGGGTTVPAGPRFVWPGEVGTRPADFGKLNQAAADVSDTKADPGVYIWSDYDGWHLWVVNGGDVDGVTGTITGNDNIASADVSPSGAGTANKNGQVLEFALKGDTPLVGMDFNPGFYAKKLDFVLNGPNGPIPAEQIHLGRDMKVATVPLTIEKTEQQ